MHVLASFLAVYQSIDLFYSRDQEQELLTKSMNDFQVSPHGAFSKEVNNVLNRVLER